MKNRIFTFQALLIVLGILALNVYCISLSGLVEMSLQRQAMVSGYSFCTAMALFFVATFFRFGKK